MISEKKVLEGKEVLRGMSLDELEKKSKSLDSLICRKKKMEYDVKEMEMLVVNKRMVKEVIIEKKEKKDVIYDRKKEEIDCMDIEEVMKGLKNVDSLRCIEGSKKEEMRSKEKLEKLEMVRVWLVDRKNVVSGNSLGKVNISDVLRKIEDCKSLEDLKMWLEEKVNN